MGGDTGGAGRGWGGPPEGGTPNLGVVEEGGVLVFGGGRLPLAAEDGEGGFWWVQVERERSKAVGLIMRWAMGSLAECAAQARKRRASSGRRGFFWREFPGEFGRGLLGGRWSFVFLAELEEESDEDDEGDWHDDEGDLEPLVAGVGVAGVAGVRAGGRRRRGGVGAGPREPRGRRRILLGGMSARRAWRL